MAPILNLLCQETHNTLLISEMKFRVSNNDVLLRKVSINDGRRLILDYMSVFLFSQRHLENHPNWRVGPKIMSVNILIRNQLGPMNNIIPFPEGP